MESSSFAAPALRWLLRVLVGILVLIGVLIAALALVDANYFRQPLIRYIAAHTGRAIGIESLHAHLLSFTPRLIGEQVTIGNPPWTSPGRTAEIHTLSLSFEWLPLLSDSFVIRKLELEGTTLHLLRDSSGRANWQAHDPREIIGKGPPLIHSLLVQNAHVLLDDARRHLQFDGTVSAQDETLAGKQNLLRIEGNGALNGRPVTFAINGDPLATAARRQPYNFTFEERSSGSRLSGRGFLPRPFDFHTLTIDFEAAGEDLKDLYYLAGIKLPDTGTYRLTGKLIREGMHFQYNDLVATSGQSDMHGTVGVEALPGGSKISADLNSQLLRLSDLGARAAGRANPQATTGLMLPDTPIPLAGLRRNDALVTFHARNLDAGALALHSVAAQLTIDHGVLTVPSMSASFPEGKVAGKLKFNAANEVPTAELDLRVSDVRLNQFGRKSAGEPPLDGLLQGRIILNGRGTSIHQVGMSSTGTIAAVVPHGAIRASFAELTGIDLTRGLGLMLRKDKSETSVRCGIASFQIRDGTLTAQSLVVDTDPVLITGKGEIHLDSEALDLAVRGQPKGWRLVRLRSPVLIRGTLAHPSIKVDARNSLAQTGEAVALGVLLTPVAALLAFVDPGLAKDADCAALLNEAKTDGVHVRPPAPQ